MDLKEAVVDPLVIGDDHPGELHVLIAERLERAVELGDDDVHPAEHASFEPIEITAEIASLGLHQPTVPRRSRGDRVVSVGAFICERRSDRTAARRHVNEK